jgi:hypothetical protein
VKAEAMPLIRLEVEGMKASILAHLGVIGSDLGVHLDEQIQHAIDSYPWEDKTKRIVHDAITKRLESYFTYGKGNQAIEAVIDEGFSKALGEK